MFYVVLGIHLLLAIMIVTLVLLQHGKGADAGAAFGSGSSQSLFGAQGGATLFSHITAVCVALFFATSIVLALLTTQSMRSETTVIVDDAPPALTTQDLPQLPQAPAQQ